MANMAGFELQRAVFARLTATPNLMTKLGGPRVYDDVPAKPEYPFISFGTHTETDWSTGSERGSEHTFEIHVWSLAKSREELSTLLELARAALEALPSAFDGYRLVLMRHEQSTMEREAKGSRLKGTLRLKALVEPV